MQLYMLGTAALLMSGLVVSGAVAVRTGRLLPWQRRHVVRPEVWGYGTMSFGAGLLLLMSWGALDAFAGIPLLHEVTGITGLLLMAVGGFLQVLSSRQRLDK